MPRVVWTEAEGRHSSSQAEENRSFRRADLALWEGILADQKIGAESSDPNRHSQPRLPGSVVGEASMRQVAKGGKITKVSALQITEASG